METKSRSLSRQSASLLADNCSGSIFILVLWAICLLSIFALSLGYTVRQRIALIQRFNERDKLHLIAEAGTKFAIIQIRRQEIKSYDALKDAWSNNEATFKDLNIADGKFDISYDFINEQTGLIETRFGVIDEERKININVAKEEELRRLFHILLGIDEVEAQNLSASIIDWRDGDSELSIPLGSAEDSYYRGLQYPYEAKDARFEVLEELILVKGVSDKIFEKIKDYITIYGEGRVNINTASREVLLALGLTREITDKVMAFRKGEDDIVGSVDDNVFDSTTNLASRLNQFYKLSETEIAILSQLQDKFTTTSEHFMIKSVASLRNAKRSIEARCVVSRRGEILRWQES